MSDTGIDIFISVVSMHGQDEFIEVFTDKEQAIFYTRYQLRDRVSRPQMIHEDQPDDQHLYFATYEPANDAAYVVKRSLDFQARTDP